MPSSKLLHLLALSALVLFTSALSIDSSHLHSRHAAHRDIAMNKRGNSTIKHCKPRSTSSHHNHNHNHNHPSNSTHPAQSHNPKPSSTNHAITVSTGTSTSNSNSTPKIGIAYPSPELGILQNFKTDKVRFYYNWSPYCNEEEINKLGLKCVPMLWGNKQIDDFKRLVKPGYAEYVLGANEPNESTQSNMSPGDGAAQWKQYIQPLGSQGYTLISPACTNGPLGKKWMQDFFTACNDCRVDAVALHWYGTDPQEMINYLTDFHTTFGRPIWVTEFACMDFSYRTKCENVFGFLSEVKKFMDDTDWVHAYFAFGIMHDMYNVDRVNQLLGNNNEPTALGSLYIN